MRRTIGIISLSFGLSLVGGCAGEPSDAPASGSPGGARAFDAGDVSGDDLAEREDLAPASGAMDLAIGPDLATPQPAGFARGPRWRLAWRDEFEGVPEGASAAEAACYSGPKKCGDQLNGGVHDCSASEMHAGLEDLNRCNWTVLGGYSYWAKVASYDPARVAVAGGELITTTAPSASAAPYDCGTPYPNEPWLFTGQCPYKTGGVWSKKYQWQGEVFQEGFAQRYGRFEVRGRLSSGSNVYPAYWMLPNEGAWPDAGEIDIMEYNSRDPDEVFQTLHGRDDQMHFFAGGTLKAKNGYAHTWENDMHTFAAEWEPGVVRFYIDNRLVRENREGSYVRFPCLVRTPAATPFFWILTDGPTTNTTMDFSQFISSANRVDYVRTYEKCALDANGQYPADCVESTLSPSCKNPCDGIGEFDGYKCYLRAVPEGMYLHNESGKLYYRDLVLTDASHCLPGDPWEGVNKGCVAGLAPAGRTLLTEGNRFYTAPLCSTTADLPNCGAPCPLGGTWQDGKCFMMDAPAGSSPFVYDGKFYYSAVNGACPYGGSYDGANCHLADAPAGSVPSASNGRFYINAACGATPDWQSITPSTVGDVTNGFGCSPL